MKTFSESDDRPETLSLAWKPQIISEPHASPGFKEVEGTKISAGEPSDRILKNSGSLGENPNQPLCPGLPPVKRNSNNRLAFWIKETKEKKLIQ